MKVCPWMLAAILCQVVPNRVEAARILAFLPFPPGSHHQFFQAYIRELAARGHNVTSVTPLKMRDPPPNYREILIENRMEHLKKQMDLKNLGKEFFFNFNRILQTVGLEFEEWLCSKPEIREFLRSKGEGFEAVITESLFVQEGFGSLAWWFGAANIELSSLGGVSWIDNVVGNSHNPSYIVDYIAPYTDRMTHLERLHNALIVAYTWATNWYYYIPKHQVHSDSCLGVSSDEWRPPLTELLPAKSLVLLNSHHSLNYPRPLAPHVKEVAGLHIKPSPLPQDVQKFMDESENGVIYFSLGGNLQVSSLMDVKVRRIFIDVFKTLNQTVLWKWESGEFEDKPDNVMTAEWFPQQDVLAHKNCKAFITHGGYLSLTEAVTYGVPLIGIPFFGDQRKNVRHATYHGYGLSLEFHHIDEMSVTTALKEVLQNPKYREAALHRSALFTKRPMTPMDEAIYWTEYVIETKGAPHLRPALASLSWYESTLLDIYLMVVLSVFLIFYLRKK